MDNFFPPLHWTNLLIIPALLVAYTVHELGHALSAYFLGDYSQVERGKITLNPLVHISWFGFLAFLLFGLGWPKPLQLNPHHFKRGYLDIFLVAISGPFISFTFGLVGLLLTMILAAIVVYASGTTTETIFPYLFRIPPFPPSLNLQAWSIALTGYMATTSFTLAFTSLLPLPGLDGFAAIASLAAFLRQRQKGEKYEYAEIRPVNRPLMAAQQRRRRNGAADIHFKAGAEYHEAQKYDDAVARYQQAIRMDSHFGPAYVNLGLAYLAKGGRKRAIQAFRGALQYADDKKSQIEAWQQLHQLSEVNPLDEGTARESMAEMGASPWTDTKPRPNWLNLGIGSGLLLVSTILLYGYLLTQLIKLLRA